VSTFDPERYWSERLAKSYSLMGVGWLSLGEPFNRWMYRVRRHVFARVARPLVAGQADASVLDIGSGTGFYVQRWQELGVPDITASDLTDVAVSGLGSAFPSVECLQLDAAGELPAALNGRFDVVSAMDVLFHIVDDAAYERAIGNLGRLVRPGGHVILSENFLHGPEQRGEHQVSRGLDQIERLLVDAGLEPVSRVPMFVLMNTPVDSPSALQRRVWDLIARGAARGPRGSQGLGAVLYPIELALVSAVREGPSTEVMVCRAADSTSS
jgi:SAM-dependent methyltransferase